MQRFIVPSAAVALALPMLAIPALANLDFNPPTWRGLPQSTTQGWDFIFGNTGAGDLPDNRVVPLRNPNELPDHIVPFTTNPTTPCVLAVHRQRVSQPNIGDDFLTLLGTEPEQEDSFLLIGIPNFEGDSSTRLRIQLTYRIASLPAISVLNAVGYTAQPDNMLLSFNESDRPDPELNGWRQATVDYEFSRTPQWHAVVIVNDSGLELDIRGIVIDTVVPAPGAFAVLAGAGIVAAGRRRR